MLPFGSHQAPLHRGSRRPSFLTALTVWTVRKPTGVPRNDGHAPPLGRSFAPRYRSTLGPWGGACPYFRVTPVLERSRTFLVFRRSSLFYARVGVRGIQCRCWDPGARPSLQGGTRSCLGGEGHRGRLSVLASFTRVDPFPARGKGLHKPRPPGGLRQWSETSGPLDQERTTAVPFRFFELRT